MLFDKHRKIAAKVQTSHTMRQKYFAYLCENEIKGQNACLHALFSALKKYTTKMVDNV